MKQDLARVIQLFARVTPFIVSICYTSVSKLFQRRTTDSDSCFTLKEKNMKFIKIFVITVVCILITRTAFTQDGTVNCFVNGNKLVEYMREYEKAHAGMDFHLPYAVRYIAYLQGAIDAYFVMQNVYPDIILRVNIPEDIQMDHICTMVAEYVKEHPEQMRYSAMTIVWNVFVEKFGER